MKILTAKQLKKLDEATIKRDNISSIDLMERASNTCFDWIVKQFDKRKKFTVICGQGNNGGDGLVLARLLSKNNYPVECILIKKSENTTASHATNLKRLKETNCPIQVIKDEQQCNSINFSDKVVIDAVFGLGLSRPAESLFGTIIQKLNKDQPNTVIAIDLPSGMYCDQLNNEVDAIVNADYTLTFHSPKQSFFNPEFGNLVGKVVVLDIGLNKKVAEAMESTNNYLEPKLIAELLQKRKTFTHKGSYGHANLVAGSLGKMGAAVLMAKGASFAGAGLVTTTIPSSGVNIMQTILPTAMCNLQGKDILSGSIEIDNKHTYGIGPGIGKASDTVQLLTDLLKKLKSPAILDADALNIIAEHPELLSTLPNNSILTPHIKEFQRLAGKSKDSYERIKKLVDFSKKHQVFVVLKDARTIISTPEGLCLYSLNGSPGMATGGSGDVLTGLLTGLLAQDYSPEKTCKIGIILHGIAGELAAEKHTEYAMTAESILNEIGNGFKKLTGSVA